MVVLIIWDDEILDLRLFDKSISKLDTEIYILNSQSAMNLLKPRLNIEDFMLAMMRVPSSQLHLVELEDWVSRLDLNDDFWQMHINFCCESYQRQLVCRTSRFDMVMICWQPQQCSNIHDHADSLNVTRVYQGVLTSRAFLRNDACKGKESLILNKEEYLQTDELTRVDRYEIHQLANTSAENLVTLHVYARPLTYIQVYSPITDQAERLPVRYTHEEQYTVS
ncbi:MAG: cysteine dioxygenase family protein [Goleter apudmare HA4340-LM2]|jgi:predicted metal-dependent enzyme (double-stranded beta helix superfamily)|nr:cysteine dioxygenase family protein [Goleter apudmare HA4340-LM2]